MNRGWKLGLIILTVLVIGVGAALHFARKSGGILVAKKECPLLRSPVDVAHVTSILYPGQTRGGHYKAHGGFRMDSSDNNAVVRAPYDARLIAAGRYIEIGEVQYIFDFNTDCGLEYRFDHFKTLAPKLQAVID